MLTVLDTRAGPNFIGKADLPLEVEVESSVGPFADICYANNKPLALEGVFSAARLSAFGQSAIAGRVPWLF